MPFNGSNTFTIVNTFVPGTTILSSAVNTNFSDIATGLSDCVTRDAQGAVTGNLLFSSTGYLGLPTGTTAQRPVSASQGFFRFNSTIVTPEFFDGTNWDAVAATIIQPQGYLTLTSGTPIIASDVVAATSVFYTPYTGQLCPVYNGTSFTNQIFSEQTLTLVSQHVASGIYDVFAFTNVGVFTIGTGPEWSTVTAGSCARGTGAGTTQLQRLNGILTNQNSITARNGATTYTVAANQGTYLGSIFIDTVAGQVTCHRSFGQSRKWGVWNAYNRDPIILKAGDGTANWAVAGAGSVRAQNGNSANSLTTFVGLAEEIVLYGIKQTAQLTANQAAGATTGAVRSGIGYNASNAFTGKFGELLQTWSNMPAGVVLTTKGDLVGEYIQAPAIGINVATACEQLTNVLTQTLFGTESSGVLSANWRG